jgi:hypothetical protein
MIFTYRSTLVDRESGHAKNMTTPIDTDNWIERLKANKLGLYGNTAEVVEKHMLPALLTDNFDELSVIVNHYDQEWHKVNKLVIFELAMFVWAGFKAGKYSADTWATVFAHAWQSGSRGMMAGVKLSQAQVIEFFKAAPMHRMHRAIEFEGEDLNAEYAALPDEFQVQRGVSTGIDHFEDGFSWTRHPQEALNFTAINCHNKNEIPGIIYAIIPKTAVLALFSYEGEVVVDPTVKKVAVERDFFKGKALKEFRANFDADANSNDVLFNTGYNESRKAKNIFEK